MRSARFSMSMVAVAALMIGVSGGAEAGAFDDNDAPTKVAPSQAQAQQSKPGMVDTMKGWLGSKKADAPAAPPPVVSQPAPKAETVAPRAANTAPPAMIELSPVRKDDLASIPDLTWPVAVALASHGKTIEAHNADLIGETWATVSSAANCDAYAIAKRDSLKQELAIDAAVKAAQAAPAPKRVKIGFRWEMTGQYYNRQRGALALPNDEFSDNGSWNYVNSVYPRCQAGAPAITHWAAVTAPNAVPVLSDGLAMAIQEVSDLKDRAESRAGGKGAYLDIETVVDITETRLTSERISIAFQPIAQFVYLPEYRKGGKVVQQRELIGTVGPVIP